MLYVYNRYIGILRLLSLIPFDGAAMGRGLCKHTAHARPLFLSIAGTFKDNPVARIPRCGRVLGILNKICFLAD
jgi:hypothetical protein